MSDTHEHPILPLRLYLGVFGLLMVLTAVTVWVAFYDLGFLNDVVAVSIACVKAVVVALFFMHLKYSARITWIVAAGGVIWLIILLTLALSDYLSRGFIPYPPAW